MPPSPKSASPALPVSSESVGSRRRSDDLPYMTMTVVAILLLLGSLWVF
jgi:hypothetical protein